MTEEEINKKAEKHCNEVLCNAHEKCNEVIKCRDWRSRRAGFFCGYEQALKDFEKENEELKKQNKILSKALNLYINWADECGIAWDNFPDMTEKWYKIVEEKGLGWIAGLTFMVMEEAKEQLASEVNK